MLKQKLFFFQTCIHLGSGLGLKIKTNLMAVKIINSIPFYLYKCLLIRANFTVFFCNNGLSDEDEFTWC